MIRVLFVITILLVLSMSGCDSRIASGPGDADTWTRVEVSQDDATLAVALSSTELRTADQVRVRLEVTSVLPRVIEWPKINFSGMREVNSGDPLPESTSAGTRWSREFVFEPELPGDKELESVTVVLEPLGSRDAAAIVLRTEPIVVHVDSELAGTAFDAELGPLLDEVDPPAATSSSTGPLVIAAAGIVILAIIGVVGWAFTRRTRKLPDADAIGAARLRLVSLRKHLDSMSVQEQSRALHGAARDACNAVGVGSFSSTAHELISGLRARSVSFPSESAAVCELLLRTERLSFAPQNGASQSAVSIADLDTLERFLSASTAQGGRDAA